MSSESELTGDRALAAEERLRASETPLLNVRERALRAAEAFEQLAARSERYLGGVANRYVEGGSRRVEVSMSGLPELGAA